MEQLFDPVQDSSFQEQIGAAGRQLVTWWRVVGERFPDRDLLLSDLLRAGVVDKSRISYRSWQLHQALAVSQGVGLNWRFKFEAEPARYTAFPSCRETESKEECSRADMPVGICDVASRGYRSVRRHIYRNYILSHKRCYSVLKNLNADEQHMLNGDCVCPVALAYVMWRMGTENLVRVNGLNVRRKRNFSLRLIGLSRYRGLTTEAKTRCVYFSFFGILRDLKFLLGKRNIRVQRHDEYADCLFLCKAEQTSAVDPEVRRLAILYPDIASEKSADHDACHKRFWKKAELVDLSWGDLPRPVNYPTDHNGKGSDVLFQIRYTNETQSHTGFSYISV